ncbi:Serine/threonine-protein kinase plk1, partial [Mortierella sp. 14UC]
FDIEVSMLRQVHEENGLAPSVVELVDAFTYNGQGCVVMELCGWGDLGALLAMRGPLTEIEASYFASQILEGVAAIHSANIIHRDLKPGNIFLTEGLRVKIGDFGVSVNVKDRKMGIVGTPGFYAPEMLLGDVHTAAVDIWCLGTIIFLMLIGRMPGLTTESKVLYDDTFLDRFTLRRSVKRLLMQMLALFPESRPKARELKSRPFLSKRNRPDQLRVATFLVPPEYEPTHGPPAPPTTIVAAITPLAVAASQEVVLAATPVEEHAVSANNSDIIATARIVNSPVPINEDAAISEQAGPKRPLSSMTDDKETKRVKVVADKDEATDN